MVYTSIYILFVWCFFRFVQDVYYVGTLDVSKLCTQRQRVLRICGGDGGVLVSSSIFLWFSVEGKGLGALSQEHCYMGRAAL